VTIGYDVPWRKVHELLLCAAANTPGLLSDPAPFILQTSLNDYHVSYQLNAYTKQPEIMAQLYAQMHQNIQDEFNQAGVEIMSPAFTSLRDGNTITIPPENRPPHYQPPGFLVDGNR
jgi:small-conductance mechanosensitive channel